jgi:flavin-dependent dehydrogenase
VTLRAAASLPNEIDLTPVIEHDVYNVRFSFRLGSSFVDRSTKLLTYMTQRRCLDEYLAGQAAECGADFRDGVSVREVDVATNDVTVRTNSGAYSARVLIGADGANGVIARSTGVTPQIEHLVALEGNAPYRNRVPQYWDKTIALDLGGLPGGYGWVFPKGEHLNIGVGSWKYYGSNLRGKLAELSARYRIPYGSLQNLRGHRLPMRVPGSTIAKGPVLLVGDAAGLIDPLSGEGIHSAFRSAALASQSIDSYLKGETSDLSGYQRAVDREIMPDLIVSRQLGDTFHRMPSPYMPFLRYSNRFWEAFCLLIRGESDYRGLVRQLGPLRPVFDLVVSASRSSGRRKRR